MSDTSSHKSLEKKKLTFISRSAPYGRDSANLCLDMALASAVFEQNVNYIFLDDGIFQLLKGQDGAAINSKTLGSALETLELYGIENVSVDKQSLSERGLTETDIINGIDLVDRSVIAKLLKQSDVVFNL